MSLWMRILTAVAVLAGVLAPVAASGAQTLAQVQAKVRQLEEDATAAAEGAQEAKVKLAALTKTLNGIKAKAELQGQTVSTLQKSLGSIAVEQYKSGGFGQSFELLFSADPSLYLSSAGALDAITRRKSAQLRKFETAQQRLNATTLTVNDKMALVAAAQKKLTAQSELAQKKLAEAEKLLSKLTKAGMRSYLRYWFDTFRLNKWSKERIIQTTKVNNENLLRDPIGKKIGCIVALPHAGNWDHAAAYFCSTGINLTAVVEKLKPEAIFKKFLDYRESIGIEAISHKEKSIPILTQRLETGKLVALVADRDMSRNGIEVNFLGGIAKMPSGPALLALKTGAPLITAYISYLPSGIEIFFDETISLPISGNEADQIKMVTQSVADNFARRIKENPVDWHMLQRIWIDEEN